MKRIIGLDLGSVTCGVAVSDLMGMIASPVETVRFDNEDYESALKTLQAGIALGESGVLKNLMQEEIACLEKMGDFAGAREKAAKYLEKYPDDAMMQKEYEFLKSR